MELPHVAPNLVLPPYLLQKYVQTSQKSQTIFRNVICTHLKIMRKLYICLGRRAPKNDEHLSKEILKILDTGSISTRKHEWEFGNMGPMSTRKSEMKF